MRGVVSCATYTAACYTANGFTNRFCHQNLSEGHRPWYIMLSAYIRRFPHVHRKMVVLLYGGENKCRCFELSTRTHARTAVFVACSQRYCCTPPVPTANGILQQQCIPWGNEPARFPYLPGKLCNSPISSDLVHDCNHPPSNQGPCRWQRDRLTTLNVAATVTRSP